MAKEIKNIGASVRARFLNLSKANGQSFDLVLTRFALERLLFRLSQSPHAERFVLKGAMLMMSWFDDPHRGTRDLDLLGFGDPSEDAMLATFRDILSQDVEDGVVFDPDTLRVDRVADARCLIPAFDGALFSLEWREALWARFYDGLDKMQTDLDAYLVTYNTKRPTKAAT
jgi:hypothetical protein